MENKPRQSEREDLEDIMDALFVSVIKHQNRQKTAKQKYFFKRIKQRLARHEATYMRANGYYYVPARKL